MKKQKLHIFHGTIEINATVKVYAQSEEEAREKISAGDFEYDAETVCDPKEEDLVFEGVE